MDLRNNKILPTAEVLAELISAESFPDYYITNPEVFDAPPLKQYLADLLNEKGISPAQVFRDIDIEKSLGYHFLMGRRRLTRDNALKLSLGLSLSIMEAQKLLLVSKNSQLYPKVPRDAAVIYSLHHGLGYRETQDILYELGIHLLGENEGNAKQD